MTNPFVSVQNGGFVFWGPVVQVDDDDESNINMLGWMEKGLLDFAIKIVSSIT